LRVSYPKQRWSRHHESQSQSQGIRAIIGKEAGIWSSKISSFQGTQRNPIREPSTIPPQSDHWFRVQSPASTPFIPIARTATCSPLFRIQSVSPSPLNANGPSNFRSLPSIQCLELYVQYSDGIALLIITDALGLRSSVIPDESPNTTSTAGSTACTSASPWPITRPLPLHRRQSADANPQQTQTSFEAVDS